MDSKENYNDAYRREKVLAKYRMMEALKPHLWDASQELRKLLRDGDATIEDTGRVKELLDKVDNLWDSLIEF